MRRKKRTTIGITILTIAIILLSTHIVYGKYIFADKIFSSTGIATPIFIVEGKEIVRLSETDNVGYYEFSIKNFNESNISETGFSYTIEIISNTDESIQFELYNENEQIPLENLKTEKISIIGNEKVEQKYKLKIIYTNTNLDTSVSIAEEVNLQVYSEQTVT